MQSVGQSGQADAADRLEPHAATATAGTHTHNITHTHTTHAHTAQILRNTPHTSHLLALARSDNCIW
jgi:hypothetical protein